MDERFMGLDALYTYQEKNIFVENRQSDVLTAFYYNLTRNPSLFMNQDFFVVEGQRVNINSQAGNLLTLCSDVQAKPSYFRNDHAHMPVITVLWTKIYTNLLHELVKYDQDNKYLFKNYYIQYSSSSFVPGPESVTLLGGELQSTDAINYYLMSQQVRS